MEGKSYFYLAIVLLYVSSMGIMAVINLWPDKWFGIALFWFVIASNTFNLVKLLFKVRTDEFLAEDIKFLNEENLSFKEFSITLVALALLSHPVILWTMYGVNFYAFCYIGSIQLVHLFFLVYKIRMIGRELLFLKLKGE